MKTKDINIFNCLFALSVVSLSFSACQSDIIPYQPDEIDEEIAGSSSDPKGESDFSYFVSEEDLQDYLRYKSLALEKEIEVNEIIPFKDAEDNTLLYIINYDEGWDLIAADKRATIPLGTSPEGSLSLDDKDCPVVTWVGCLAEDVSIMRKTAEAVSNTSEVVEYNINFWRAVTADKSLFTDILNEYFPAEQTRDPSFPFVPYPNGHYELSDVYYIEIVVDSVPHLIPVHWSQKKDSCNLYVPWRSDTTYLRAPAGCVAVAGAQVLYYLHSTIEAPTEAPTSAYCWGSVGDWDYIWDQYNFSSSAWGQMTADGGDKAGMLIASVAKKVNTLFGNECSIAEVASLLYCFSDYGISSVYSPYNENSVKAALLNGMPSIIGAFGDSYAIIGHCFIIDGYLRHRHATTYVYNWVWDDNDPNAAHPKIPSYEYVEYESPYIDYFYMNWGEGTDYRSSRYAVTGDWFYGEDPNSPNFIYNRVMVQGFSIIEE